MPVIFLNCSVDNADTFFHESICFVGKYDIFSTFIPLEKLASNARIEKNISLYRFV